MKNNIEKADIFKSLDNNKKSEEEINKIIEKHKENLTKLNDETSKNTKNTEQLTEKVNNLSELLNSSGSSLTRAMEDIKQIQIEAKELELWENVSKIMDLMVIDINNNLYI